MALPIGENLALMSESATREQSMRARRATFPNLLGSPLAELRDFISSGGGSLFGGTGEALGPPESSYAARAEQLMCKSAGDKAGGGSGGHRQRARWRGEKAKGTEEQSKSSKGSCSFS